jgi:hypothetical protein
MVTAGPSNIPQTKQVITSFVFICFTSLVFSVTSVVTRSLILWPALAGREIGLGVS